MINGLILLNLSPNLDLTSNNHFTGAFLSFLSVALELKVGKGLHQERLFPEGTALSFELSLKLALLSRHTWLSLLDVFFFFCAVTSKGKEEFFATESCYCISVLPFLLRILWGVTACWVGLNYWNAQISIAHILSSFFQ